MITGHDGTDDGRVAHNSVWLNGVRVWPDGSADSLVVEAFDAARAERTDIKGSVVWRSSGHLADVLAELLELKPPDDPQPGSTVRIVTGSVSRQQKCPLNWEDRSC
jgi:hypothetical protein